MSFGSRGSGPFLSLAALAGLLYAAAAAAALVFGQARGIDSPNDSFEVNVNGKAVTVRVSNGAFRVVLPPGVYSAVYKGKRAQIVSSASSRRQDLEFK